MESPLHPAQRMSRGIITHYSVEHLKRTAFCAADFAFQVGAVVINDVGHVLLFQDPQTGVPLLPLSPLSLSLGSLKTDPLRFVEDQTGLRIERLPLLHADKRYRDQDVQIWMQLQEDLTFENDGATTTNPFSFGLYTDWYEDAKSRSLRQTIILWYGGFVSGQADSEVQANHTFVPVEALLPTMLGGKRREYTHGKALALFERLWCATKTRPGC